VTNVVTLGAAVMSGGRCSLAQALELLTPDFTPMEAAAEITQAIHGHEHDRFPLYCNGEVVKAHIRAIANVVPKSGEDGWDIESTGPGLGWARGAYNWELEDDAVLALKPQPDTRAEAAQATAISAMQIAEAARAKVEELQAALQVATEQKEKAEAQAEAAEARVGAATDNPSHRKPARKFTDNWPMLVATEMIRLARHDPETLENISGLIEHMRNFLNDEIGWRGPNDDKEMRAQIRLLLGIKR